MHTGFRYSILHSPPLTRAEISLEERHSSNNNTKKGHWILILSSGIVHAVTGTIINATAIVLGSGLAMLSRRDLSESKQQKIKLALGCFAMVVGTHLIWISMHGGLLRHGKQMLILFAAITLGNILGMILGIQKSLNRLAKYAKHQFEKPDQANAFKLTSALFCLTPFAVIGAVLDGISGNYSVLLIKAVMDGVAAHSFTRIFGKSVILSAIPVLAFQGNLAMFGRWLGNAHLSTHMIEGITGACGIMVFTSLVLIIGVGKPRLADYLPSIVVAAFLAHWFW